MAKIVAGVVCGKLDGWGLCVAKRVAGGCVLQGELFGVVCRQDRSSATAVIIFLKALYLVVLYYFADSCSH